MTTRCVGLVGAGGIARVHLPAWLALGADVVVFSERGTDTLRAQFPGVRGADSFDELLQECDVIDVVTPTPAHREYVEAALRAGKDVVCEKPLARTAHDAAALVDLADTLGRQLYPAHVVRFFPQYAALHEQVRSGAIGSPAVCRYSRTGSFPLWADWFADESQSGGVVLDLMIHDLDIARWISGDVVEIHATQARDVADDGSPIAVAQAVLTHAGGALSHVRATWGIPGTTFRTTFHVAGADGIARHDTREDASVVLDLGTRTAGGDLLPPLDVIETPYVSELREFATAFDGGPPPRVTGRDGVIAVKLALATLESIRTGAPFALAQESR